VIDYALDYELFKPFQHLAISVEDNEDENLLQHFAESNRFIEDGLESGGGVFVHW
jgi:dual specificity phosphatase 12